MSRLGPTGLTQLLTNIKTWVTTKLGNYVTTDTTQTVTGKKYFTNSTTQVNSVNTFTGSTLFIDTSASAPRGSFPESAYKVGRIYIGDGTSYNRSWFIIDPTIDTNRAYYRMVTTNPDNTDSARFSICWDSRYEGVRRRRNISMGDLLPSDASTYNLGESGNAWQDAYINKIHGISDYTNLKTNSFNANTTLTHGGSGRRVILAMGAITLTVPAPEEGSWFLIKAVNGLVTLNLASNVTVTGITAGAFSGPIHLQPNESILLCYYSSTIYNATISTIRRSGVVGRTGNVPAENPKHWFKIAENYVTATYRDPFICLRVFESTTGNTIGTLCAHCRINNTVGVVDTSNCYLQWQDAGVGFNLSKYALTTNETSGTGVTISLWCQLTGGYSSLKFEVVSECGQSDQLGNPEWVLTRRRQADGDLAELLDTDFTKIVYSTLTTLKNDTTGKASNVTGTVAIANGGTGATTRLNAVKALTNEAVGTPTHFLAITTNWGKAGYTTVAQAKTVLGITGDMGAHSDSEYVHKTGDETVGGSKTFSNNIAISGTYLGTEASTNERTNIYLLANRDTAGTSGAYISRFRQNRTQGAMGSADSSFISFDFLENDARYTRCFIMGLTDWDSDGVPQTYWLSSSAGKGSLGTAANAWNKVYANSYYLGTTSFTDKFVTTDTAQTITGVKTLNSDTLVANLGNAYRIANSAGTGYGVFQRVDNVNWYLMVTAQNDALGSWTSARPASMNLSTGVLSINGNAATATEFSANKSVTLTGDVTGTASSKAGWSVATTLANSGVTAGTYGPSADVTGNNNATISVPEITVDAKGRVTSVTNRTLTCKNNTYNVYDKTLTIQKNGTNVATFTSNSNTDVTANITVPTKVSELTNDSGYLTSHQSLANYLTKTTNVSEMGRYIDLHYDNATSKYDYDARLYVDSQGTAAGGGSFKIAAASAYAPAPASNANDTRIATTAWVNSKGYLTSHQSLANYVTLNGTQTISGIKTISTHLRFSSANTRGTAPSASEERDLIDYKDSAGNRISLFETMYYTDKSSKTSIYAYKTTAATGGNIGSIGIGCDASGNVYTYAPTPASLDNSTKIATTAFVYNNAAKHLSAATNIYVANVATGNGSGSNTSNYMALADLRTYLATVHMHSAASNMNNSYNLQILFKAGDSFGNATFDATKMPGVRNLILNTSTGTNSTVNNYSTNSPTFGNITVTGDIAVTMRNLNCTGRISSQYGAQVVIDTYMGISSLMAANSGYLNVAKNMVINVCDAHVDYLFLATNNGILSMWPGATVTINFRQQCYYSRSLFMSSSNGTALIGYSSFKLTGTEPMAVWGSSGTLTGTSETAAATVEKAVTLASGQTFTLTTNATAKVKFTVDNTANNPTLNIGGTGAKPIYWNNAPVQATMLMKNITYDVKYNGSQFVIQNPVKRLTNNDFGVFRSSGNYNQTYNSGSWNFTGWTLYYGTGIENSNWRGSHIGNIQQNVSTSNNRYPVLISGTANATATTSTAPCFAKDVKINPSTNSVYATDFYENGTALSSKYVQINSLAGGNVAGALTHSIGSLILARCSRTAFNSTKLYANVAGLQLYPCRTEICTGYNAPGTQRVPIVVQSSNDSSLGSGTWRYLGGSSENINEFMGEVYGMFLRVA